MSYYRGEMDFKQVYKKIAIIYHGSDLYLNKDQSHDILRLFIIRMRVNHQSLT